MILTITPYMDQKCFEFATAREKESAYYHRRGAFKFEDVYAGALGEVAAYNFLHSQGILVKKPDFTIQSVKQKSFNADLSDGTSHFHIKSQTGQSEALYGRSWILQRKDPLLNKDLVNNFLVPTVVNLEAKSVEILGIIDINAIIEKRLIGECRLKWFQRDKVAIYWSDLSAGLTREELYHIM